MMLFVSFISCKREAQIYIVSSPVINLIPLIRYYILRKKKSQGKVFPVKALFLFGTGLRDQGGRQSALPYFAQLPPGPDWWGGFPSRQC